MRKIIAGRTILLNTSTNTTFIASELDETLQTGTRENDRHIEWTGELDIPVIVPDENSQFKLTESENNKFSNVIKSLSHYLPIEEYQKAIEVLKATEKPTPSEPERDFTLPIRVLEQEIELYGLNDDERELFKAAIEVLKIFKKPTPSEGNNLKWVYPIDVLQAELEYVECAFEESKKQSDKEDYQSRINQIKSALNALNRQANIGEV